MGVVRTIPNVGQDGNPSKITTLEITYGGKESPFGGIHSGLPPAYIEPNCFAANDGFVVADNKLCVSNWQKFGIPANLWGTGTGVLLLKIGTFYNTIYGQLNYALGYTQAPIPGAPPSGAIYTFYISAWNYIAGVPTIVDQDSLSITLFDSYLPAVQASIVLDALLSHIGTAVPAGSAATVATHAINYPDGSFTSLTLATPGTGYIVGQFVNVTQGGNNSAVIVVDTVDGGGGILTFHFDNPGYGYDIPGGSHGPILISANPETPSTCSLTIDGPNGTNTYTVASSSGSAASAIITTMVAAINAGPDPNVAASPSIDGLQIVLTANASTTNTIGVSGNAITVTDTSVNSTATEPPPVYFSCRPAARHLEGGIDLTGVPAATAFTSTPSTAVVGGTLYIANLGPFILQYSGPDTFTTLTMYQGVKTLRKFAGSLIGLRTIPQLGTLVQNADMIFSWSAANNLSEWSAVTAAGNTTGAGFSQLDDIADPLIGLVVSNNVAFILRSQGISYATSLGSGTNPFQFAHIGLGDKGEGAQNQDLVCQYDQTGAYVGNSDIFQVSGSISSIGDKIKSALFKALRNTTGPIGSAICVIDDGGESYPLLVFVIGLTAFVYNTSNTTWAMLSFTLPGFVGTQNPVTDVLATALSNTAGYQQFKTAIAYQVNASNQPVVIIIDEGVPNNNSVSGTPLILFPQEEVLFGRQVTVDALYVSLWGNVSENTEVKFFINGTLFTSVILDPVTYNTLAGEPTEIAIFPTGNTSLGLVTARSPQLSASITPYTDGGTGKVRIAKIMMRASFDPNQSPV